MKVDLTFTNRQLLDYIKQKTVGNYNKDMLLTTVPSTIKK